MSLLTRDDEWPEWTRALDRIDSVLGRLVLTGFGAYYVATGNIGGRLIGVGLLLWPLIRAVAWTWRYFAKPS